MSITAGLSKLAYRERRFEPGEVWLAGAGPGDPGCLTLDVLSALSQADAVVYDALVDPSLLEVAEGAERHFVGKRGGRPSMAQDAINRLLVELAGAGRRVLRLKGGDPYVFGRGGEEALALAREGIPFRVLPGVTSAVGGLASAGIPATMRGINKAIIFATGHATEGDDEVDWHALARTGQPLVIYMGLRNLLPIADALIAGGLRPQTPAAVVMSATMADERVLVSTLGSIASEAAAEGFASPALIVVGDIVSVRNQLLGSGE